MPRDYGNCCGEFIDECPCLQFEKDYAKEKKDGIDFHLRLLRSTLVMATGDVNNNEWLQLTGAWWDDYQVHWPTRRDGDFAIVRDTRKGDLWDSDAWHGWFGHEQLMGMMVPPGKYTMLVEYGNDPEVFKPYPNFRLPRDKKGVKIWMADTPSEILDHMEVVYRAFGRVLINGLGLGILPHALLQIPCVDHIDIVENNEHVLRMVAPNFAGNPRVTIHQGDAYTFQWPSDAEWDIVWHDIWPSISPDNLPEMKRLRNKYRKRTKWQACWREAHCVAMAHKIQQYETLARR